MVATILTPWLQNVPSGRYAFNQWATDGQHVNFQINYAGVAPGYLSRGDVKYYVTDLIGNVVKAVTVVSAGSWQSDTVINVASDVIGGTAGVPIPTGYYLFIFRDTPKDKPEPDFNDGSVIDETNLDTGFRQAVYVAAEMVDKFGVTQDSAGQALTIAQAAKTAADAATAASGTAINTANTALGVAGAASSKADTAIGTANAAVATADGIDAKATDALTQAGAAVSTANTALSTANGIDAKAQTALDNSAAAVTAASTASSDASTALSTANGVDAKATTALSNSATALVSANSALAAVTGKNRIINGACRIAQRAAKLINGTTSGYGGPDRYQGAMSASAGGSFFQSSVGFTFTNGYAELACQQQVNAIATNLGGANFWSGIVQQIEGVNCFDLKQSAMALSFQWIASITGTYSVVVRDASSSQVYTTSFTSVANVPKYVTISIPAPATPLVIADNNALGLLVRIGGQASGTLQAPSAGWAVGTGSNGVSISGHTQWGLTAGAFIVATNLQLESGATATAFERIPLSLEQANCERYYEVSKMPGVFSGNVSSGGTYFSNAYFKTTKRITSGLAVGLASVGTPSSFSTTISLTSAYADGLTVSSLANATNLGIYQYSWTADAEL